MKTTKIAILGSNSHIAKGLINNFLKESENKLHLYTTSPDKLNIFLKTLGTPNIQNCFIHNRYSDFSNFFYDSIINCVGVGTQSKLQGNYSKYFTVTEEYDNLCIKYLFDVSSNSLYICFSSGAVYGGEFSEPVNENTLNSIPVNNVAPEMYYSIAKLNSEAKHRVFSKLNIIDLRIFSYFSRFADLNDNYFINEIINSIIQGKPLITGGSNIIRDYIHPDDLFSAVLAGINFEKINGAFDITSKKPAEKKEILDFFSSKYNLECKIIPLLNFDSTTGNKNNYFSTYNNAVQIGYKPKFTSIETIKQESKIILGR